MNVHITATGGSSVSGVGRAPKGWVPRSVMWIAFALGLGIGSLITTAVLGFGR